MDNCRVRVMVIYGPLVLAALSGWQHQRLYLALDTTVLWNRWWHYCWRLPCDVLIHTTRRYPLIVGTLYPPLGEARLYENVGLWIDGKHRCNLVVATVQGAKESWAVVTDEPVSLQTLWQYALRFRVEELFLDSKSGAFELEDSRLRSAAALERLYLVAAIALLFATTQGMAVQLAGLWQQVDLHWRRGISYLKIGLRWLQGVMHKARTLLSCVPLLPNNPQTCFASLKAKRDYDDHIGSHRVRSIVCKPASTLS